MWGWGSPGRLRRKGIVLAVAGVCLGLVPAGAWAVSDVISNSGNQFTQPTYQSGVGDLVQFQHSGAGAPHNVTSTQSSGGQPLFSSATISSGTTPVNGTQFLAPGTYPFVCTIHAGMAAELVVRSGAGAPAARPDIEVSIISRKLDKVVAKGKLLLEVQAITKSDDVSVSARLGKKVLGVRTGLDLPAGQSARVSLKLKRAVTRKLAALDKAKVTAEAMVPFGDPDTAKRVLK